MAFRVAARTILHLGAELISSDGVALYELIKNAFDAGSTRGVDIEVSVLLPSWPAEFAQMLDELPGKIQKTPSKSKALREAARQALIEDVDRTAPGTDEWEDKLNSAQTVDEIVELGRSANSILIRDTGHGMSKADLNDIYLTIGTRYRLEERESQKVHGAEGRAILGEKGIGRLSVMRLGQRVVIRSTRSGEAHWNILDIDWSRFSHQSDDLLENIDVAPRLGERKQDKEQQGTEIVVTRLNASWSRSTVKDFAEKEAAKLNNPFDASNRYRINLRFNGAIQPIPQFDQLILNNAHAHVQATLTITGNLPTLRGKVSYTHKKRERSFELSGAHLASIAQESPGILRSMGHFKMEAFWFNRQLLRSRVDGGVEISNIVNQWSGGLMLFRDGFRVMPYGDGNDDWLDLDSRALASQGYKVNRKQLIGRVEIGSLVNPALTDQTNREGLRDSPEKVAMVNLLKHVLEVQLRRFLNEVDNEEKARLQLDFSILGDRVRKEKLSLRTSLKRLRKQRSETAEEQALFREIDKTVDSLEEMMDEAKELADEFERGRSQYIHLAGLGLMVEFLAHELNRATQHALGTLADNRRGRGLSAEAIRTLELQLKTLQKRLSVLDPATTSGRQRREKFDIVVLAEEALAGHAGEFERHHIKSKGVKTTPANQPVVVFMVKGMVIQILENLLANSLYWLKQESKVDPGFSPMIRIEVDSMERLLRITDNGPGIPRDAAEDIFKPFFTTKPPGEGKGLGLYIAREIARYNKSDLELADPGRVREGFYNTFALTLPA